MESLKNMNTKASQFEILVSYMSKHPDLSKGYLKTPEARTKSKLLWSKLADELNAEGPPQRDGTGWKKVWADFKVHTKAKIRKNKINFAGTGGGPSKHVVLTPLEQKVSELLKLNEAVNGILGSLSFGVNSSTCNLQLDPVEEDIFMQDVVDEHDPVTEKIHVADNPIGSQEKENVPQEIFTPKTKKQETLLEKQVRNQITYQNNICAAMKDVNENLKGIFKYVKRNVELKEKNYKLKKESLELKKAKFELKKQQTFEKNKNTVAKLELKKEILKLRQQMNESF